MKVGDFFLRLIAHWKGKHKYDTEKSYYLRDRGLFYDRFFTAIEIISTFSGNTHNENIFI